MVRKLFLTPATLPAETIKRCIEIPASQDWLGVLNAALLTMVDPFNYEQLNPTDLDPGECSDAAYAMFVEYLKGICVTCDEVIACAPQISAELASLGLTNPNTVDATQTQIMETRFPFVDRETALLPPPAGCDNDILWGGIIEIANRIDQYGRDFLEQIVADTDAIERVADLIAIVPLFGDILGESLLLLASEAQNLLNAYNSYSSVSTIEDMACDLFQLGCSDCRYPTYNEVLNYFANNGITGIQDWEEIAWQAIVDYLIGSSGLADRTIWHTVNAVQLFVRYLGGTWLGQTGTGFLDLWGSLGEDTPSNNWIALCGGCVGAWQYEFDFEAGDQGFIALFNRANYVAGVGWQGITAWYDPNDEALEIGKAITQTGGTITNASMRVTRSASNALPNTIDHLSLFDQTTTNYATIGQQFNGVNSTDITHVMSGLSTQISASRDYLDMFASVQDLHPTITIKSIAISGFGPDPFA